jgi:hypothetical protein
MKAAWLLIGILIAPTRTHAQGIFSDALAPDAISLGAGWAGFADFSFIANAVLTLLLATALGAALAYHPKHLQTADTFEEIEAPKVYILYAVIGALIGIMVVKYGLVVGFVLFGIGGLIRFRTLLRSAILTGNVIFATLVGLACGLDLPHVGVLATAFGYALIYFIDAQTTYRIDIQALPNEGFASAVAAYRDALESTGCKILSEKKNPTKQRVAFLFHSDRRTPRSVIEQSLETQVDAALRGSVDWQID